MIIIIIIIINGADGSDGEGGSGVPLLTHRGKALSAEGGLGAGPGRAARDDFDGSDDDDDDAGTRKLTP